MIWTGVALLGLVLAVGLGLWTGYRYLGGHMDTILRNRLVASLRSRFNSPVELDRLHVEVHHGLHVTGDGLRILYLAGPTKPDANPVAAPPMVTVDHFEFETDLHELLQPTLRITKAFVRGMTVHIPPHPRWGPGAGPDNPQREGQPRWGVIVDEVVVTDSQVAIEMETPGKLPLQFGIANLTLNDVGLKKPFEYDAMVTNPKPVGVVHATGHFGPWQKDNPRDTPLEGVYDFSHADLSSIKGIGGTLSSTGRYRGTLGEIEAEGETDTPDFRLDISGRPVDVRATFKAHVDGMTGDTKLEWVEARLLHTVVHASGSVTRLGTAAAGITGHDTEMEASIDKGRVEDLLTLGVKTSPPVMRGAVVIRERLSLPPGPQSVSQKLRLAGSFTVTGVTFSNAGFQTTVDKLSMRAQGLPKQANAQDAEAVTCSLTGRFEQANAVIDVQQLTMTMPGATGDLTGKYSLDGQRFDFSGKVKTQATVSQMTTGWKSKLLKPFDGLLRKDGAGMELPITIKGTKSQPKFGVDTKHLFE